MLTGWGPAASATVRGASAHFYDRRVAAGAVSSPAGASAFGIDTDQPPPPGVVGTPYSFTLVLKAGAPPYAVLGGRREMAPGLRWRATGRCMGRRQAPGTIEFTVEASQYCAPEPKAYAVGLHSKVRDKLAITTPSLPSAVVGTPYTAPVSVVGNGRLGMGWKVSRRRASGRADARTRRLAGQHDDLGHADDGRDVDVHRQGRRHGRLPTRPLDDQAVHARRRRAVRGRSCAGQAPDRHRRQGVQRDARDGYRRPLPVHVGRVGRDDAVRAHARPCDGCARRKADDRWLVRAVDPATDADGRVGTADAAITVARALDLVTTRLRHCDSRRRL